jgi:hypothetical protein
MAEQLHLVLGATDHDPPKKISRTKSFSPEKYHNIIKKKNHPRLSMATTRASRSLHGTLGATLHDNPSTLMSKKYDTIENGVC